MTSDKDSNDKERNFGYFLIKHQETKISLRYFPNLNLFVVTWPLALRIECQQKIIIFKGLYLGSRQKKPSKLNNSINPVFQEKYTNRINSPKE